MNRKSFIAGEDLTGKIGYALKAEEKVVKLQDVAGDAFGIVMNDNKKDMAVGVALTGDVCKAKLGGAVVMGAILTADAQGKLVTIADGQKAVAMALEAGAENDLIYVVVK